ncbi:thiamine-phosphate diphosphorylase [Vibrio sp. SCSIO 43135]|uniref:Thiamine-phosphate diphosphorylase n=1 Tax=Vibrio paucivorans TaxID=2829489 RepID=A0A9X3HQ96_9VIBR|nr:MULTISPECIES: thiamine-phosphate diphosphorylase [Vibrio]MCW8332607.1 thiamine-phosphate diphosphorylase [Vibrio paucivorans]USD44159.1 thiamine-phosphate diphosphorylase [Vibrio sp. SCSIO 43135]
MIKERIKREYDLRILNQVSESEYESRMAIWDGISTAASSVNDVAKFVDVSFSTLQQKLKEAGSDLSLNRNEFVTMANEEISYIKAYVADNTTQYFWYATIALMVCGVIAICY